MQDNYSLYQERLGMSLSCCATRLPSTFFSYLNCKCWSPRIKQRMLLSFRLVQTFVASETIQQKLFVADGPSWVPSIRLLEITILSGQRFVEIFIMCILCIFSFASTETCSILKGLKVWIRLCLSAIYMKRFFVVFYKSIKIRNRT